MLEVVSEVVSEGAWKAVLWGIFRGVDKAVFEMVSAIETRTLLERAG